MTQKSEWGLKPTGNHHPFCLYLWDEAHKHPQSEWNCRCVFLRRYDNWNTRPLDLPEESLDKLINLLQTILRLGYEPTNVDDQIKKILTELRRRTGR